MFKRNNEKWFCFLLITAKFKIVVILLYYTNVVKRTEEKMFWKVICLTESLESSSATLWDQQCISSVAQLCLTLCDPMPGLPVYHQLPESTQTHVH